MTVLNSDVIFAIMKTFSTWRGINYSSISRESAQTSSSNVKLVSKTITGLTLPTINATKESIRTYWTKRKPKCLNILLTNWCDSEDPRRDSACAWNKNALTGTNQVNSLSQANLWSAPTTPTNQLAASDARRSLTTMKTVSSAITAMSAIALHASVTSSTSTWTILNSFSKVLRKKTMEMDVKSCKVQRSTLLIK